MMVAHFMKHGGLAMKRLMVAAAILSAAPAVAQETGTLITHRSAQVHGSGKTDARETMLAFAECLVSRSPGRTANIIDVRIDSPEYERMMGSYFDEIGDLCMSGGELTMNETLLRGSVFQALYQRDFGDEGPTSFDPALDTGYRAMYTEPVARKGKLSLGLESFGECVARADGATVRKLLMMRPDSQGEAEAFQTIQPFLNGCIPVGVELTFSLATLKGALAEGMYRLSRAATANQGAE